MYSRSVAGNGSQTQPCSGNGSEGVIRAGDWDSLELCFAAASVLFLLLVPSVCVCLWPHARMLLLQES